MAAWTDGARQIAAKLEIRWDGSTWTDETAYLMDAQGDASIQQIWQLMGGTGVNPPNTAQFTLAWADGRYSPFNSDSDIYAYISANQGYGLATRFSVGLWGGSSYAYTTIFTGVIDSLQIASARDGKVTIRATDASAALSQNRISTALTVDTEAGGYISALATLGNVASTDLDPGLYAIPWAWLDNEAIWTEMCLLAQAEGGMIRFDRSGQLLFANAEAWVGETSAHTFTVSLMKDLAFTGSWQNVYNRVTAVYADRVAVASETLFSLRDSILIAPGETHTFTAQHKPAYSTLSYEATITDAMGSDLSASVAVVTTGYAGRTEVAITNNHATAAALVSAFTLSGQYLSGDDDHDVTLDAEDSVAGQPSAGNVKAFRCAGNPYVQTQAQAAFLAEILRDRLKAMRAIYSIAAPGIPTLEPGGAVTVVEAGSGVNCPGFITAVTWTFSGGAYNATYRVVDATGWYLESGYFEIGVSLLGGSAKLFY